MQILDPAARRGAGVDGVSDGARAAADAGADRGAGVPRAVRAHADAAAAAAAAARLLRVRVRRVCSLRRVRRLRSSLLRLLPADALPRVTPLGSMPCATGHT